MRNESESRFAALPLVQREVGLLLVLSVVALGLFTATKGLAAWEHQRAHDEAALWFREGERHLEAGRSDDAIVSLRRAAAGDRDNPSYALELARALADSHQDVEARVILTRLRENKPDDADINRRLAELVARTGDPAEAVRYFNLAIYSLAPAAPEDRRRVRRELAAFLLSQGDRNAASAELIAIARETPDEAPDRIQLAALFAEAGDDRRAFDQYVEALKRNPDAETAAAGAGHAALRMHAFVTAERYLRQAVARGGGAADVEALGHVRLVLVTDPLASGLQWPVRARRLAAGLAWAQMRLATCAPEGAPAAADDAGSLTALRAFARTHRAPDIRDSDQLADGLAVIVRAAEVAASRCAAEDPLIRAWQTISEAHGASAS